jgi:hypothetical protein
MKFSKKKRIEYTSTSGKVTSSDVIAKEDVLKFHGKKFYDQWLIFSSNLNKVIFEDNEYYYYYDYKKTATTTDMWLRSD